MSGIRAILSTAKVRPDYFGGRDCPHRLEPRATSCPPWIPVNVWLDFLSCGDGVRRYRHASRYRTGIILARRNHVITGLAEPPSDPEEARRLLAAVPVSRLEQLIGQDDLQISARWAAGAAPSYNRFMYQALRMGLDADRAIEDFEDASYRRFAKAFTPVVGDASPTPAAYRTWLL